jgi:hypothetical protein
VDFPLSNGIPDMSIAAEKLPLPHRAAATMVFKKNLPNFTTATVLNQKYWY